MLIFSRIAGLSILFYYFSQTGSVLLSLLSLLWGILPFFLPRESRSWYLSLSVAACMVALFLGVDGGGMLLYSALSLVSWSLTGMGKKDKQKRLSRYRRRRGIYFSSITGMGTIFLLIAREFSLDIPFYLFWLLTLVLFGVTYAALVLIFSER